MDLDRKTGWRDRSALLFHYLLLVLCAAYALLGKGIAYLHLGPAYLAEFVLVLGLFSALLRCWQRNHLMSLLNHPAKALTLAVLLGLFLWGAIRTLPYVSTYGLNSLRDAALWGYSAFVFLLVILAGTKDIERTFRAYRIFAAILVASYPLIFVLTNIAPLPLSLPGAPVPVVYLKPGDASVHLAGAGVFLALGLDRAWGCAFPRPLHWFLWLVWGALWLTFGSASRAALLAPLLALLPLILIRPRCGWVKPLLGGLVFLLFLHVSGLRILTHVGGPLPTDPRWVASDQIWKNVESLVTKQAQKPLDTAGQQVARVDDRHGLLRGPTNWRKAWWKTIIGYTVQGPYFWLGKGYGVNLADADGFQVANDHSVRSPHNVTMTFLARSGVPGAVLWLIFLSLVFGFSAWRLRRLASLGQRRAADTLLWLICYWLAALFVGSTDVYLEGPMGGVWFWVLCGFLIMWTAADEPRDEFGDYSRKGIVC